MSQAPFPTAGATGNGHHTNGTDPQRWTAMTVEHQPVVAEQREEGVLEQAIRIIRKRKWLILQAAIIVPIIVGALTLSQTKTYSATASLLFRSPDTLLSGSTLGGGTIDPNREAATNGELVSLDAVADRAAQILHNGMTGSTIKGMVSVDTSSQGDVAPITASSSDPKTAAAVANAYGQAYIQFRQQAEQNRINNAIAQVQSNLAALSPADRAGSAGNNLRQELQTLQLASTVQGGDAELVQRASVPTDPSGPHVVRNVLLGALLGLVLGFALAAVLEKLDRRVKAAEELEDVYGLPVLARIPRSRSLGKRVRQNPMQVMSEALSRTQEAEAFRTLRANLRYFNVDHKLKSLLVASPMSGEGKSTVASFLAISMAAMGDRVCLVEADLRKSSAETPLSDLGGDGLSLVLAGFDLDEALTEVPVSVDAVTDEPRVLTRLPHGPLPPNPSELLESERMRWVITQLEQRFDTVIIDSPALTNVSDALSLVPRVSGVLLVSGVNRTTVHAAHNLRKQLALLGGHPLGVVANFATSASDDYYYGASYKAPSLPGKA